MRNGAPPADPAHGALVEQLLDLSRLDAEAIEIAPEHVDVRSQVEEIVHVAAGSRRGADRRPGDTIAVVDRNALDRIVTNLVTNAFRYGAPPVSVRAEQTDRHLRLTVEDGGQRRRARVRPGPVRALHAQPGLRVVAGGTGLGLAIARSYARAHGGDLVYEDAEPHGACFRLILPDGHERMAEEQA